MWQKWNFVLELKEYKNRYVWRGYITIFVSLYKRDNISLDALVNVWNMNIWLTLMAVIVILPNW